MTVTYKNGCYRASIRNLTYLSTCRLEAMREVVRLFTGYLMQGGGHD